VHLGHLCLGYDRGRITFSTLSPAKEIVTVLVQGSFEVVWDGSGHDSDEVPRRVLVVPIAAGKEKP